MDGPNLKGVQTLGFVFEDHIHPFGLLPRDPRANACWYYCKCAMQMVRGVDEGAELEGEKDRDINLLNNLARNVAAQYSLDSPDDFLLFIDYCHAEAVRLDMTWDSRIEKPSQYTLIRVSN